MVKALSALLLAAWLPLQAGAQPADPQLEQRMLRIAAELRCLVCQNQSLAESDAGLAQDLRQQVRTMLRNGASDERIRAYMTERYGDFVLYRPPVRPGTWALWFGPAVLLAVGAALLVRVLRRRQRLDDDAFEPDPLDADGEAAR